MTDTLSSLEERWGKNVLLTMHGRPSQPPSHSINPLIFLPSRSAQGRKEGVKHLAGHDASPMYHIWDSIWPCSSGGQMLSRPGTLFCSG